MPGKSRQQKDDIWFLSTLSSYQFIWVFDTRLPEITNVKIDLTFKNNET